MYLEAFYYYDGGENIIKWLLNLKYVVFPQRSPEYSNCQYLCKLCLVHIENIQGAHKHIKEKRHKKNIMVSARISFEISL